MINSFLSRPAALTARKTDLLASDRYI